MYRLLKASTLLWSQSVCLGYYWNNIDLLVELFHELNVNLLQPAEMRGAIEECSLEGFR